MIDQDNLNKVLSDLEEVLPGVAYGEDNDGQVVIYTGCKLDPETDAWIEKDEEW